MGFIYGKEKRSFDDNWMKLAEQYKEAGFDDAGIQAMRDFDWELFCRRRTYENRNQELPSEMIDNSEDDNHSILAQKFLSLTFNFDESEFDGRYDWIETIDDPVLAKKLGNLSDDDKELLTLLVFDGYTQTEIGEKMGCSQVAIFKKIKKIKLFLK